MLLQELKSGGKYEFFKDGLKRRLQIKNCSSKDDGKYTCKLLDQETTAELYVEREHGGIMQGFLIPLMQRHKLLVPVYSILPATTAVIDYAVGLERLLASRQFLLATQMAVSLMMMMIWGLMY